MSRYDNILGFLKILYRYIVNINASAVIKLYATVENWANTNWKKAKKEVLKYVL